MSEHNSVFRKKSMDRIASPEQLTDYIRVANPGVWLALAAVVILLISVCVWGVFGRLETTVTAAAVSDGEKTIIYVKEGDRAELKEGMTVKLSNGNEYVISAIEQNPVSVDESFDKYALHISGVQQGDWVYAVSVDGALPKGVYTTEIVVDSVSPMSFIFN